MATIKEERRNLFDVGDEYYLAHCIAADFCLGAGIAKQFKNKFGMKGKLKHRWETDGPVPACLQVDHIFNLVTKRYSRGKPTYDSLRGALCLLRDAVVEQEVEFLAMPCIGCGLDRLQWSKVKQIIGEIFRSVDIEILVCFL